MFLGQELKLKNPIGLPGHEALLSIYYTASRLRKKAGLFLQPFGLTDVQFNLLMLLKHQSKPQEGLSQAQLSDMMLVNRANITSLIDRMEKAKLVTRNCRPADRRFNVIKLTSRSKKLLAEIEPLYAEEVTKIMAALKISDQNKLMGMLKKIRQNIS